jgi:hypothetical protein
MKCTILWKSIAKSSVKTKTPHAKTKTPNAKTRSPNAKTKTDRRPLQKRKLVASISETF